MPTGETQHGYPSPAASRFVRRYMERRISSSSEIATPPVVARSCALLDFVLEDPLRIRTCTTGFTRRAEVAALVAIETHAKHHFLIQGNYHGFQIHFRPTALKQLFGLPMPELTDQNHAADAVLGPKLSELRQRLGEAHSFQQRIQLADAFVVKLGSDRPEYRSVEQAAGEIVEARQDYSVERLARDMGFSTRNFQRTFRECVGIPPKLYARLVRFEATLKAKATASQISWAKAAQEAGYYDQMHMIRDFREFTGGNPTAMFGQAEHVLSPHADFKDQ